VTDIGLAAICVDPPALPAISRADTSRD